MAPAIGPGSTAPPILPARRLRGQVDRVHAGFEEVLALCDQLLLTTWTSGEAASHVLALRGAFVRLQHDVEPLAQALRASDRANPGTAGPEQ